MNTNINNFITIILASIYLIILLCSHALVYAESDIDIAVMGIIKNKVLLRINGGHYTLKKGEYAIDGVELINFDKNRKFIALKINGDVRNYRLGYGTATPVVKINLSVDKTGVYKTIGKINNKSVSFIVDTGATLVSINSNTAESLGIDYKNNSQKALSETANGMVSVYIVKLSSVEVGDIKLNNIEAAIHEGEFPKTVLLGMSFLKRLKMEREDDILSLQMK